MESVGFSFEDVKHAAVVSTTSEILLTLEVECELPSPAPLSVRDGHCQ
jgi:hypothetical protein